jgi:hypothetical protein
LKESCGINHTGIILTLDGQPLGLRTRGDDDRDLPQPLHEEGSRGERGVLTDEGDVGVRKDALYPGTELGDNLSHTFTGLFEGLGMDVSLRGDTSDIETGASDVGALEDRDLQALLGGIFSSTVPTRAGSYNA